MALAASTVFEIRQQATAANVNSGGFNPSNATPGTDYSQQLTAQYTFADLASTIGTTNPPVVTSASHSFVSADCGNLIHINSGTNWTAGFYEIVSVSGGAATLDRACGTSASLSSGTYHVGGALSLQDASDSTVCNAMVAGNKVWVLGGASHPTYTLSGTLNITTNGGTLTQISWEGYNSVRGDKPTGALRPVLNSKVFLCGNNFNFTSMIFSSNIAATQVSSGTRCHFYLCKFVLSATTANIAAVTAANYNTFLSCEFVSYAGRGLTCPNEILVANSYFHDSDIGILNTNGTGNYGSTYTNCIFDSMVTAGISYSGACDTSDIINGCTFFGGITNKTGTGISLVTNAANKVIINNIFTGLATGVSVTDASGALQGTSFFLNFNDFYSNTTDVSNCTKGPSDIALNPGFANVGQLTGTGATVSGSTLAITSATGITINQDFVYIISGTGATAQQYLITNVSGTTLTLSSAPGGSGTNIVYQITTGRNFYPGANMGSAGSIGTMPGGLSTGFQTIGALQRAMPPVTLATTWIG
jgi:hypothetical protein